MRFSALLLLCSACSLDPGQEPLADEAPAFEPSVVDLSPPGVGACSSGVAGAAWVPWSTPTSDYAGFPTVREAVEFVSNGPNQFVGPIYVCPGTHYETLVFDQAKQYVLLSASRSAEDTILAGPRPATGPTQLIGGIVYDATGGIVTTHRLIEAGAGVNLQVENITFQHGTSETVGGAVYADGAEQLNFLDVVFRENYAHEGGGAIAIANSGPSGAGGTVFENNSTSGNGGVVHVSGVAAVWYDSRSIYTRNRAGQDGGAIYSDTTYGPFYWGGQMGGFVDVQESEFSNNQAGGSGGAIYAHAPRGETPLTRCEFIGNVAAESGGAIVLDSPNSPHSFYFTSNGLQRNEAGGSGSAIHFQGRGSGYMSQGYVAGHQGSAIAVDGDWTVDIQEVHLGDAGPRDNEIDFADCALNFGVETSFTYDSGFPPAGC